MQTYLVSGTQPSKAVIPVWIARPCRPILDPGITTISEAPHLAHSVGSLMTIKISKLIEQDRKYVKGWVEEIPPVDKLTVRVVGAGRARGKRVEVDVKAGKTNVVVSGGCDGGGIASKNQSRLVSGDCSKLRFTTNTPSHWRMRMGTRSTRKPH